MELIDGKAFADQIISNVRSSIKRLGLCPQLAIIKIGESEESAVYMRLKAKALNDIGGKAHIQVLPENASPATIFELIEAFNQQKDINGIILQLPLPSKLNHLRDSFLSAIAVEKDVDGFHPLNRGLIMGGVPKFVSCAAEAAYAVIASRFTSISKLRALLVGDSFDLIQSLSLLLIKAGCDVIITSDVDNDLLETCDFALFEKGRPGMINENSSLHQTKLLIDAGFFFVDGKTIGNIDLTAIADYQGAVLPVPGGLGPILIAKLIENIGKACCESI